MKEEEKEKVSSINEVISVVSNDSYGIKPPSQESSVEKSPINDIDRAKEKLISGLKEYKKNTK